MHDQSLAVRLHWQKYVSCDRDASGRTRQKDQLTSFWGTGQSSRTWAQLGLTPYCTFLWFRAQAATRICTVNHVICNLLDIAHSFPQCSNQTFSILNNRHSNFQRSFEGSINPGQHRVQLYLLSSEIEQWSALWHQAVALPAWTVLSSILFRSLDFFCTCSGRASLA